MGPGVDGTAARSGGAAAVGQLPRGTGRIPLLDELARSIPVGMHALGLGVGVSPNEHLLITGNRVIEQDGLVFVDIPGARARMVPCAHDWAERLVQVAANFRGAPLIGEDTPNRNRLFNLGKGIVVPPNFPRPTAARFRTTWMVGLLSRGVPFQGFMNATGWEQAQHLEDFVPYLYEWDTAELHRAIAGVPK